MKRIMILSKTITQARARTQLDVEGFSNIMEMSPARLREIEGGAAPTSGELGRVAEALGLEIPALMRGEDSAPQLLFRAMGDAGTRTDQAVQGRDWRVLGSFVRCAGRTATLRALLGEALPAPRWLETSQLLPPDASSPPHEQGEALAALVRTQLGLGDGPIPSMHKLLSSLGIEVLVAAPDQLGGDIDGACVRTPHPAVLINPRFGDRPWSFRTTMAHELCHLLCNRDQRLLVSPHSTARSKSNARRWDLFDRYIDMEKRANAFAAHFLAPVPSIIALLEGAAMSPVTAEAVSIVMNHFGIGQQTAANLIWRAYRLSERAREQLLEMRAHHVETAFVYDEPRAPFGLFEAPLGALVYEALRRGVIAPTRARQMLEIHLDEPLPQRAEASLTEAQRAPVMSKAQVLRNSALRHVREQLPHGEHIFPGEATRQPYGWSVALVTLEGDTLVGVGELSLSHDLSYISDTLSR